MPKSSGASLVGREAHDWHLRFGLTCCRKCGFVKNANSDAKGCVGLVKVEFRSNA